MFVRVAEGPLRLFGTSPAVPAFMKPSFARLASLALLVSAPRLLAHPGHDGHELTWDLGHLAAHPVATVGCLVVLGAAVALLWRLSRRAPVAQPVKRE